MSAMLDLAEKYFISCAWQHSRVAGRDDLIELVFDNPRTQTFVSGQPGRKE